MRPAGVTPSDSYLTESNNPIDALQIKKQTYLLKTLQANQANKNLKELYNNLKLKLQTFNRNSHEIDNQNSIVRDQLNWQKIQGNDQENLDKKSKKLQTEVQHMTHLLNILVSSNNKLKDQVNSFRNSRVIYSNVYKNLQKQIRRYEDLYKMEIIENLALGGAFIKIKEKLKKIKVKYQRQFQNYKSQHSRFRQASQQKSQIHRHHNSNAVSVSGLSFKNLEQAIPYMGNSQDIQEQAKQAGKIKKSAIKNLMKKSKTKLIDNSESTRIFQAEEKKIYLQNIVCNLRSISGIQSVSEICNLYFSLDKKNQHIFEQYQKLDAENKVQQERLRNLQRQIFILKDKSQHNQMTVTPTTNFNDQLYQLIQLTDQLQKEQIQLQKIQKILTQKIDMNCKEMSEQDIQYHIKKRKDTKTDVNAAKNLQKILEKTQKKKNEESFIMSVKQMHKSNLKILQ